LIPTAIDATSVLIALVGAVSKLKDAMKANADNDWMPDIIPALGQIKMGIAYYKAWKDGTIDLAHGFSVLKKETGVYKDDIDDYVPVVKHAVISIANLSYATGDLARAQEGAAKSANDWRVSQEQAARAAEQLELAFDKLEFLMSGTLSDAEKDFVKSQDELIKQMEEVKTKMDKAYGGDFDDLQAEYDELSTKYQENADEHDKATKRIIFNFLKQQMAAEGMANPEFFNRLAEQWGLVADAEINLWENTEKLKDEYASLDPGEAIIKAGYLATAFYDVALAADGASIGVGILAGNIERAEGDHYANLHVTVSGDVASALALGASLAATGGNVTVPGGANGLDMVVPPGHPGDTFPVLASSGERVVIIPQGEAGNTNNFGGITINAPAGANGMQIFKQFKQALEAEMRASRRAGVPYSDY
jgi:hypothetical protein